MFLVPEAPAPTHILELFRNILLVIFTFPSHYGSRSTCEDITRKTHEIAVSIPLWFSLNGGDKMAEKKITSFHPTMVLAQPGSIADTVRADTFSSSYGSPSNV